MRLNARLSVFPPAASSNTGNGARKRARRWCLELSRASGGTKGHVRRPSGVLPVRARAKLLQKVWHRCAIVLSFVEAHCCHVFNLLAFSQLTSQLTRVHCINGRPQTIACSRKNLSQRSDRVHADIYGN